MNFEKQHENLEEKEEADFSEFIEKEKGFMEGLSEKGRDVARMMVFLSAFSFGVGISENAFAGEYKDSSNIEASDNSDNKEERNTTEAISWVQGKIEPIRSVQQRIENKEDAESFLQVYVPPFWGEFYLPTEGALKEGPYGIKTRDYSVGDLLELKDYTDEVLAIVDKVGSEHGLDTSHYREQLEDMRSKIIRKSSVSGQSQEELLKRLKQFTRR